MFTIKKFKLLFRFLLLDVFLLNSRIKILRSRDKLASEEMNSLQNELLLKSILKAKKILPAYRELEVPADSSEIKEFIRNNCTVITKNDLLKNRALYYPNGGKAHFLQIVGKSSGTTGTPLEIYRSLNSILWENSFVKRHWQSVCNVKMVKRATLRGDNIISVTQEKAPYWVYNDVDNQLLLSSRHLSKDTCKDFIAVINHFNPDILQAYPSTAFQLAQYASTNKIVIKIPYVFTASEMLYPYQREVIENTIGQVCDFYGMAERIAMATECRFKNLHVNSDYSYVEILDENDNPTDDVGFVVGTTLHNHVMPLIRYKLSDRTKWKKGPCECGSNYPMIEPISGKFEDIIYDIDNTPISPSLITFAFKGVSNIEKSQVVQTTTEQWEIRIVPSDNYRPSDGDQIINNLNKYVSKKINAEVIIVSDIARTKAGKYRWVLNETTNKTEE
ncbi:phenylacetate--CoA ligase family protein [Colwellia sp. TT2012]|uniref:phenylacetate--CoA ligase family protein n=1 Tax=Colwellia sp. TT2012 TaxID=1720342 RepID=UPI00070F7144|nr:phenylacetate--CoA ligase family protein [Colwellia sp. TT2012]